MNKLTMAVVVPVIGLFVFVYSLFALANSTKVEVDSPLKFTKCNTNGWTDGKLILVASDVSTCGYAVELTVAGKVIKGSVDGVIDPAPSGMAQIFYVQNGKFASAIVQTVK